MQNKGTVTQEVYSAMQVGKPYAKYKKTILGKVYLEVLNPFSGNPEGVILHGNPMKNQEGCFVEVWSVSEDVYLKRRNKKHFEDGTLQVWKSKKTKKEKLLSEWTDAEVTELINSPFLKLQSVLNKTTSESFVLRILTRAQEMEKSEKLLKAIEARLNEIQNPIQE